MRKTSQDSAVLIAERYGCRNSLLNARSICQPITRLAIARNLSVNDTPEGATRRRVRAALSITVRGRKPADTPPRRHNAGEATLSANDCYHAEHHEDARFHWRVLVVLAGRLRGLTGGRFANRYGRKPCVHLREKCWWEKRDALVLPGLCRPCAGKSSPSTVQSPAIANTCCRRRRCLAIMPLHYLRAQYAQDLYRYFAERGYNNGNMYYCRAERKGQAYDKGGLTGGIPADGERIIYAARPFWCQDGRLLLGE